MLGDLAPELGCKEAHNTQLGMLGLRLEDVLEQLKQPWAGIRLARLNLIENATT